MKPRTNKILKIVSIVSIILVIIFISIPCFGRPGGGHSYSGGGGGGGSSSGSGGGDNALAELVFYLLILFYTELPPYITIPVTLIGIGLIIIYNKRRKLTKGQISSTPRVQATTRTALTIQQKLQNILLKDPNFSKVLFLDFVSSLYTKFHSYKQDAKKLSTLTPFIYKSILTEIPKIQSDSQVSEIVIGSINIIDIEIKKNHTTILTEINSNYTVTTNNKSSRFIITERWALIRSSSAVSGGPEKMSKLTCPSCGAAANFTSAGECEYCGTKIEPGTQQWMLINKKEVYSQVTKANSLLSYANEVGTNFSTILSPTLNSEQKQFVQKHNKGNWDTYWTDFSTNIASIYFHEIYKYWSSLEWIKVRHLLTDRLWDSYNFWIKEYKRYNYQNKLDETTIKTIKPVKIETDKYYEAITVRIYASAKDYVVNKNQKVIAGNHRKPRIFSEYWTFVRRAGVENDSCNTKNCPSCGAPADKINQSGYCEYCNTKINNGDFSWVLTMITQDEEYKG